MTRASLAPRFVRAWSLAPVLALAACGAAELSPAAQQIPAAIVNDACGVHTTADSCQPPGSSCRWLEVGACPAGADCPAGVCVTPDPCGLIGDEPACATDSRCAWSVPAQPTLARLCPVGAECGPTGGYCHARDASGGGCTCVRPLVCPESGVCPDVACDCPPPPEGGGGGSGGGTCTCACAPCAAGESCPPCKCDCGGGGGGSCGGGSGGGTCTCACPACVAGQACPPCDCACGGGSVGVTSGGGGTAVGSGSVETTMIGGANTASTCVCPTCPPDTACAPCACPVPPPQPVVDPCAKLTDAASCQADTVDHCTWYGLGVPCLQGTDCKSGVCQRAPQPADTCGAHTDPASCKTDASGCGWVELDIVCITTPCPSGACVKATPVPGGGGGGCGCACPACASGQSCPPCTCDCCTGPIPQPLSEPPLR